MQRAETGIDPVQLKKKTGEIFNRAGFRMYYKISCACRAAAAPAAAGKPFVDSVRSRCYNSK